MTNRIAWVALSCSVVVALLLASCKPVAEEKEAAVPGKKVEPVVAEGAEMVRDSLGILKEKPRYGGMGRFLWIGSGGLGSWDPGSPDVGATWHLSMYDTLTTMDFTKGPSGTGELAFTTEFVPEKYRVASLAESFEQTDPWTVIYHLRQGVHYHDKPPANGREMVADDIVFAVERTQSLPRSPLYKPPETPPEGYLRAVALDKYTVKITLPEPNVRGFTETNFVVYPPEAVEEFGNLGNWENAIGTGAFICADYLRDSFIFYVKNPNYWDCDPFFPENRVPYMDGYTIVNTSYMTSALAAVRTGKIDWLIGVTWEDAKTLRKSHPDLLYSASYEYYNKVIEMRNDFEPFSDIRFRKALAIAIDRKGIVRDLYKGNAEVVAWPYSPYLKNMNIYTPLEELPEECQELFEYNPEKAKQLLAEVGYPNGLKMELLVSADPAHVDTAQIVKMYWDAIGVETTVEVLEVGAFYNRMFNWKYDQTALVHWPSTNPFSIFDFAYRKDKLYNYSKVSDKWIVEVNETLQKTADLPELERIFKEAGNRALAQCYNIGLPVSYHYAFWWPWIKGYSGEWWGGFQYRWLDLDLRKEMIGY